MEKFVIIDGNNLMFRAFYALPQLSNFEGEISNAVFGFTNILVKIIKEVEPKYMAVTFDVGKKNFRHETFAEYKGTRKPTPPELISQFPIIKDLLKKMNVAVIEQTGLEADDLMGCLSRQFETENIIVSADRDTFQLINDNTSIMFPKKGVSDTIILTKDNLKEYYGVEPNQVVDLKSLMGDSSDNIPGVTGVGEKTAQGLIDKYKTLDGVYENIAEIKGKLQEKLIADKDNAYMSKYLATIITDKKVDLNLSDFEYDFPFNNDVLEVFKRYQFNALLKKEDLFDSNANIKIQDIESIIIDTEDKLLEVLKDIEDFGQMSFYMDETNIEICTTKNYKINTCADLLSTGIDFENFLKKMKPIFESEKYKKTLFDTKTLMHTLVKFGISLKGVEFDCLIARYLINSIAKPNVTFAEVLLECGMNTNALAYAINSIKDYYYAKLEKMGLLSLYYDIEMPLINVLFDMEMQGFKIDKNELVELGNKYKEEIVEIEEKIYDLVGVKFNIASPKQLGEILFDKLELNIPSNKKKSTSIEILNEIEYKHPVVSLIIRYRSITKLYNTYIVGFENILDNEDKVHTIFNQTLTSTGRLSSSEPNLQNIPVRTEEGRGLRRVFIPSFENGYIISADYSQIELRLLASFSNDEKLIEAFNLGQDIHSRTASEIFGVDVNSVDGELRRKAKAINFGIVYGISDFGLSQNIGISRKDASEYIKKYFEKYPSIDSYMKSNVELCEKNGYIKTLFGRIRPVPEINSTNYNVKNFGQRVAMNMPLQGSASDIIKLAMVKIFDVFNEKCLKSKIILQVHDELVIDCHPDEVEVIKEILKQEMENVVDLSVKLTVNIECGKTWYDAK